MLNDATKRKINNCRDTLVGKIPVPMSQIEQITLAMTYKFMSDIDAENSALGGTSFFEGEYAKYAWNNLMDKRNGAQERLNLYSEGLDSMSRNPHIPELFRDIFRNAYLPFKDPTTLDRFLKQIDEFHYGHSEELGNAFEYLLSTAGSQGDAGQFRTPRHIIDFLVAVVDPSRDDTILDPACGTAGFLISAYKHIIEQGGSSLTIEDKQDITRNIVGYDISHDMVRLSLVNMYLHHFADPRIYEYDTLSMETRWNEEYSCILANPPFMTPKGGIEPHKRFSIRATKSEVLFTDYIMEHLSIHGKAGIIVPEGVIFQSGNAYKDLRKKMIMDNYLYAVVSLPSGIFQPYSGVKTSILFFDRQIAKKTDNILFLKVANDGYDLGAQRREISKNDLPKALEILKQYKNDIDLPSDPANWGNLAHLVPKSKIAESGDYKLSGDLYRVSTNMTNSDFEMVELGEVCDFQNGYSFLSEKYSDNGYQVIRITNVQKGCIDPKDPKYYPENEVKNLKEFILKEGDLLMSLTGNVGRVGILKNEHLPAVLNQRVAKIQIKDQSILARGYLFHLLNSEKFERNAIEMSGGVAQKNLGTGALKDYKIPLPPLEIQEQIVAELDGYQRIIDGARQIVQNYKPTIKIDPEWEMVELGEVCMVISGQSPESEFYNSEGNGLAFYQGKTEFTEKYLGEPKNWTTKITKEAKEGDILISVRAPVGPVNIATQDICIGRGLASIRVTEKTINEYVFTYLRSIQDKIKGNGGAVFDSINRSNIEKIKIPLPPLEIQEQIVTRIEVEQRLVDATKELIAIYEGKVKGRIGEVWGESNLSGKE